MCFSRGYRLGFLDSQALCTTECWSVCVRHSWVLGGLAYFLHLNELNVQELDSYNVENSGLMTSF